MVLSLRDMISLGLTPLDFFHGDIGGKGFMSTVPKAKRETETLNYWNRDINFIKAKMLH